MVKSHGDFVTIIDLPEGDHQYRYFVDGEWKNDPQNKIVESDSTGKGKCLLENPSRADSVGNCF